MTKTFKLNSDTPVDLEKLIASRLLIQANSGGGKSHTLRRILEQSHGKVQHIIIDPEGEFSTLREHYEYVYAAKNGDVPADPKSAAMLARKLLEFNADAILDLYELHPQERKHFVKLFLDAMVNSPKELHHPCLVIIDEIHTFAPEKGQSEALDAVIGLASLGRKREFCLIGATQRISKLHKDVAAECNNKLIGRTGLDIDMKRAAEELGFTSKEQMLSLRNLDAGEFFVFGPAISKQVIKTKIGEVKTEPPKVGKKMTVVAKPTDSLKKIIAKMGDIPSAAKKEVETVADLKEQIRILKSQKVHSAVDEKKNEAEINRRVKELCAPFMEEHKQNVKFVEACYKNMAEIHKLSDMGKTETPGIQKRTIPMKYSTTLKRPDVREVMFASPGLKLPSQKETGDLILGRDTGDIKLTGPEQKIADAIAWFESIGIETPEQTAVAFLAGYTYGGGGFNNPRGALKTKGFVEYRGNQIVLTETGREYANKPEMMPTTAELHEKVLAILPGPEKKLLVPLLEAYPNAMTGEELAEASGYKFGTGGFNNPKGRLRTLGLVEYPSAGQVKARSLLFID